MKISRNALPSGGTPNGLDWLNSVKYLRCCIDAAAKPETFFGELLGCFSVLNLQGVAREVSDVKRSSVLTVCPPSAGALHTCVAVTISSRSTTMETRTREGCRCGTTRFARSLCPSRLFSGLDKVGEW